jgi:hypothetical protein
MKLTNLINTICPVRNHKSGAAFVADVLATGLRKIKEILNNTSKECV